MKAMIILFLLLTSSFSKDIILGVVPQQSPIILSKKWIPLTKELSKLTGYNIIFKTEPSIPLFEKALYSGQYDIAYMNPYHFVMANKKLNFEAKLRADKLIQGIIVANRFKNIDLLTSKCGKFLFPAPKAFAATLITKYELKKKFNIDLEKDFKILYVNSHDSVYKGVSRELGQFGGGIVRTFKNLSDKKAKNNLSIVYRTDKYPSHPIAFDPRLPNKVKESLINGFLNLSSKSIEKLNITKVIKTSNKEYDVVKDLAIELNIY